MLSYSIIQSSIVRCHERWFICSERRRTQILNIKHVWYWRLLIGLPLTWFHQALKILQKEHKRMAFSAATLASSEQVFNASPFPFNKCFAPFFRGWTQARCFCFYSWNLAATNMRESREHHPYSFVYFVFHWNRTRTRRASWQRRLSSICFSSLVTFDLASLREITCLCKLFLQSSSVRSHGLVDSFSVHVQRIIRLKSVELSSCLWSPMIINSVKIWKSSSFRQNLN